MTSRDARTLGRRLSVAMPLVAAVMLAGWASVSTAQPADMPPPGPHPAAMQRMGPGMMPGMGMPGARVSERDLDAIGASAEQKTQLRALQRAAMDDLRKQHDVARELHRQMQQMLAAPQIDAVAAEALRVKLNAQHDVASKRMLQAALDASAVLTAEQRQKLAERRKQQMDRMDRMERLHEGPGHGDMPRHPHS